MCGIFGFSGWDKANVAKLKMLGMFNQTRGKDSCGYYFNDKLVKGTYLKKEWISFIESNIIEDKGKSNLFIGHCRYSTVGANTEENAHPFDINNKLILAHNGTISNIWELCREYEFDHKGINVDSLALGYLMDLFGFQVLEKYKGYAAILATRKAEPDSLYVYHGASRVNEKDEKLTEERPLFFMKAKEGIYFSSMENSLMAIRDNELQKPERLEHNRLIKVTKGKFAKSKMVIHRENMNVGVEKKNITEAQQSGAACAYPLYTKDNRSNQSTPTGGTNCYARNILPSSNNGMGTALIPSMSDFSSNPLDICLETKPPRCFNKIIEEFDYLYYQKGRHWRIDDAALANGVILTDKDGVIYDEKTSKEVHEHYFYRGVMLKSKNDWELIQKHIELMDAQGLALSNYENYNFATIVSKYSKYPVTLLPSEGKNVSDCTRKFWFKELKTFSGSIKPVWADRNYIFKIGQLINVLPESKKDITFMSVTHDEYANYDIYTNSEKKEFNNGEIISKSVAVNNPYVSLIKYFDRNFKSMDEVMAECPSTIYIAIGNHVKDMLSANNYNPGDDEIIEHTRNFIEVSINDNVTFRENMDASYRAAEEYIKEAYMQEIQEEDDDSTITDFTKAIQDVLAEQRDTIEDVEYEIVDDKKKVKIGKAADQKNGEKNKEVFDSSSSNVKELPFKEYPTPAKVINMINPDIEEENRKAAIDDFLKEESFMEQLENSEAQKDAEIIIRYAKFLAKKSNRLKTLSRSKFGNALGKRLINISSTLKDELQATAEIFGLPYLSEAAKEIEITK